MNPDTAAFSRLDTYGGHNQAVKYEGSIHGKWLVEGSFARAANNLVEVPSVDQWSVTDDTVEPHQPSGGIGFYEVGNQSTNWQYGAKVTNLIGDHQIRYGVLAEHLDYLNTINRTGPTFMLPNGVQTTTGAEIDILSDPTYGQIYRVVRANTSNVRDTSQNYTSFFVQDSWRIGSRLTINPGLRYEHQALTGTLTDLSLGNEWGPRIGATWDPAGNGRSKVFGSWGRFYTRMPNDLAARSLSADAGVSRADYFDAALTQPIPDGTLAADTTSHFLQQGVSADVIDPSVKAMYVNEVIAGVEHEVLPGLNMGVRYIHRDIPRVLEDVQPFPDGRVRSRSPRHAVDRLRADESRAFHSGAGRFRRRVRDADSPLQRHRGDRRQAALESMDAPVLVPLLAPARHLRRVLSATTTGSRIRGSRRCSTFQRTIQATRRSACRSSATGATSASSARRGPVRSRSTVRTSSRRSATISSTWG